MIFNSITRELNQQDARSSEPLKYSRSSYFPQKPSASDILRNAHEPSHPSYPSYPSKHDSALARMNDKIADNIEYLRYKDRRANELRSSRVSNSSNRSHRSHHSNHSNKSLRSLNPVPTAYFGNSERVADPRPYMPSEESKIKTFVPPSSFNNDRSNNYWKEQSRANNYDRKFGNDEFRYFTRNPVTIDANYCPPEAERDGNQSLKASVHSNVSEPIWEPTSQSSKLRTLPTEHPRQTGIEWNASFGSSIRNSNVTPSNHRTEALPQQAQPKQDNAPPSATLSPLSTLSASKKVNKAIIISAGLIALGVLILLLQVLK